MVTQRRKRNKFFRCITVFFFVLVFSFCFLSFSIFADYFIDDRIYISSHQVQVTKYSDSSSTSALITPSSSGNYYTGNGVSEVFSNPIYINSIWTSSDGQLPFYNTTTNGSVYCLSLHFSFLNTPSVFSGSFTFFLDGIATYYPFSSSGNPNPYSQSFVCTFYYTDNTSSVAYFEYSTKKYMNTSYNWQCFNVSVPDLGKSVSYVTIDVPFSINWDQASSMYPLYGFGNINFSDDTNPLTEENYSSVDTTGTDDYTEAEDAVVNSTSDGRSDLLEMWGNLTNTLSNTFIGKGLMAVTNILDVFSGSGWLYTIIRFSLILGLVSFVIGTVQLVSKVRGRN